MDTITLTINNRKVVAKPGMTVLEAAQQAGIYIPTLCYHKDLFPEGHCRVCLVDIKGQRSLQPACMFPVADGMEVNTHSHAVRDARRLVVELLLSNHPNECLTCVRSRNCELQALAKEMGMPHGSLVTGKMVAGLRELGFNRVFDTDFTADLTIIEEGNELIKRINEGGELPLITSCCPGWIKFAEHFYPDLLDNLSTCKSPQQMFGAVAKTYYAEKAGVNPAKMVVVSIMPCIAKKFECERPEMNSSGYKDVDLVLTTRELGQMLREAGIDLTQLPEENYDDPLGTSTGAGVIFGATGGVMEAVLRTAYEVITSETLGTYQCFQETYHPDQYRRLHPSGPKADYNWRLGVFDRAFAGGVEDVGMGVLFGLCDYRFDLLALLAHARYLDSRYGVGPHTISFPRIEPAQNAPAAEHIPYPVCDDDLLLIVAVIRLAVPYTGIIMSTRETPDMRRELLALGVSQISAASRVYPGGYSDGRPHVEEGEQFCLGDTRSVDMVIRDLCEHGYVPSFCTACYRLGRTGHEFMDFAKPGKIQRYCTPNALLTFQEYLIDYASPETRVVGERLADELLAEVAPPLIETVKQCLAATRAGERDLYL